RTGLFDTLSPELPPPASPSLVKGVERWRQSEAARRLVKKYADLGLALPAADSSPVVRRQRAEQGLTKLRAFTEQRTNFAKVDGADDFFALLDHKAAQLENEIARYQQQDKVGDALALAIDDLNRGRYDACLKQLDVAPLSQAADADVVEQLRTLRKRAEYLRAYEELASRTTGGPADRDLYNDLQTFLRRWPDPPTPAEADQQAKTEARRDRLKMELTVASLGQATNMDSLLEAAAKIVGDNRLADGVKQDARRQVNQWLLDRAFPRLEPPDDLLGKQEAVTKSGQRKIGIFFLPPGAEQWRFWTDRKHRQTAPRGDEQISRDGFEQPPSTPQYVTWAQAYDDQTAKLVREGGSKTDWQQLADQCESWEKDLAAYRERWGLDDEPDRSCRDWTFRDAAATARSVLRHWDEFMQVLGREP
ncbi:MAG TPA: hypothetical protein VFW87_19445, partial [Pirellulales bacterium]|nr:hypothetical protein [Pirellulales bacterium]